MLLFFFQAEDGIRAGHVTGVQTCALPISITGPSGCGKSTLLGVIGGLAVPTAGVVRIGGEEVSSLPDRRRSDFRRTHVGFVYQADNLLPFLTVVENIELQSALDG